MASNLDILILTASFGTGHRAASLGIKESIQKIDPSLNIEIIDVFNVLVPKLSNIMYKGYDILIKTSPRLYNYFHYKDNERPKSDINKYSFKCLLSRLKGYILDKNPKLIISTFPVTSQYISNIKDIYGIKIPLITCITDVVNGWEWITPNCDKYFVATRDVKEEMLNMGIEKEKIIVTGIPLREQFLELPESSLDISIPEGHKVLMIMGGGMGLIPDDKNFYKWLNGFDNLTTIVLTGKNDNLFKSISNLNLNKIVVLKYTDKVALLMAQTDILVTKSGGITTFEAIASNLPIIVYKPELGQEIENAKFIHKKLIGDIAFNMEELQCIIADLINDESSIIDYKAKINEIKNDINMRILGEESIKMLKNS